MPFAFSELSGQILTPTTAVETDLTSGRSGLPGLNKRVLLLGYKTAAGTMTAEVPYQCTSLRKAIELAGIGSHLACMVERALRVAPRLDLWIMSYAENGAAVAASGTLVFSGVASGSGTAIATVGGRRFAIGVVSQDTADNLGARLAAKINAANNAPFTAANASGTVTVTARNKGPGGNTIRLEAEITSGITTTFAAGAATLASGATEGDPTNALAAILPQRFHMIVSHTSDSTVLGLIKLHQEGQSDALTQKWGFFCWASTGTQSAADTLAAAVDSYRGGQAWLQESPQPEFELAAAFGAKRGGTAQRNKTLDNEPLAGVDVPADETVWPLPADVETALASGIVSLMPQRNGTVLISRNVNSRQTSPAILDSEPFEISDYIDEDLITIHKLRTRTKSLKTLSAAGTPGVVTPASSLAILHERMLIWDLQLDYTEGAETDIENGLTAAERNATDPSRLDHGFPFRPVYGLHVAAFLKTFVEPGL